MSSKKILKYTNLNYKLKAPYEIFADFECFIQKDNKHVPSGFHYVAIDDKSQIVEEIQYTDSSNVVNKFFERVFDTCAIYKVK